jgi:hypothetical protein
MLRIIAGIIVGFIVMFVLVMATFGIATLAFGGLDGVVQEGSYWTTNTFNIIVLIGGLVAAIVGGLVCAAISRNSKAAFALATIVLALGAVSAVMNMNKPDPPPRTGSVTMQDMQVHGKEPNWFAIGKTITGAIGVLIGASFVRKRTPTNP